MKTGNEYKQSLRNMRPNIYKFGELIKDVTSHPATKRTIQGHAQIFDASLKPRVSRCVDNVVVINRGSDISLSVCASDC